MGSRVSSPTFVCVSCSTRTTAATAQGALVSVSVSLCAAALWMETCPSSTWLSSRRARLIPGLTDNTIPRRLGPKRASKIRKLFNLTKEDDVCQYVIKRPLPLKEGKKQKFAAPKVQRLVTPVMLQRKRHRLALKRRRGEKNRLAAAEYAKILAQR